MAFPWARKMAFQWDIVLDKRMAALLGTSTVVSWVETLVGKMDDHLAACSVSLRGLLSVDQMETMSARVKQSYCNIKFHILQLHLLGRRALGNN